MDFKGKHANFDTPAQQEKRMKRNVVKPILSLFFLCLASQANAGGLYMYEMGTEDIGLANAGSAARAQDASIIANNLCRHDPYPGQ